MMRFATKQYRRASACLAVEMPRCLSRVGRARRARRGLFVVCAVLLLIGVALAQNVTTNSVPLSPAEMGLSPPPFPVPMVGTNTSAGAILAAADSTATSPMATNTVFIIPSNTIIRIQVRDQLDSDDWFELVVFKSRTPYKFFRVLFETEAPE
jgi:hypothetical protein